MSMSMSRFIGGSTISTRPCRNCKSFSYNPISHASFTKNNDLESYSVNHGFAKRSLKFDPMMTIPRRSFVIRNNITPPPSVPLPSGSPSGSMRNWIVGIVLTFVLPFCTHKWGPLLVLKNKVDNVVNQAEFIMEAIESVAEKVDNVIDNITDDLPENSELRKAMEAVDELVEGVAKGAHFANDIIDKVEEVEDKLESMIMDEAKEEKVLKKVGDKEENPNEPAKV
ncbi:hypothetical protein QVD17_09183 [Tagetes erecta]|uniref:Uncharacterized protein n=1 Tax=Tagetes erecta TaxID=13708 RepID=A0AAD8P3Q5_TARER|nr:hypothetical protein QVD17_09183 [Tagetes erecta]